MKKDSIKNIIEKYNTGNSTLEEEQFLFEATEISEPKFKALGAFVNAHKQTAPKGFNATQWEAFEKKTSKNRRFRIGMLAAAASIALLIMLTINNLKPKELSYAEKKALLDEVLSMFPETEQIQTAQDIVYEDDLVIVYTKPE